MFSVSRWAAPASLRSVAAVVMSAPAVGFSGSRHGFLPGGESAFLSAAALVPVGAPVLVGCARGVDASVREWFPGALVFSRSGSGRSSFALRSIRLVRSLRSRQGVLVAFPGGACPAGLRPSSVSSRCFSGHGSGCWGSVAFAIGLGCPVLVWVPSSSCLPAWGRFTQLGGGWFQA